MIAGNRSDTSKSSSSSEERLRRADKELRAAHDNESREAARARIQQLQQDLEYIKFFPKNEKYVSLFMDNGDAIAVARREKLRELIRANIAAAAAAGVELEEEETGSEEASGDDDSATDMSEDDFFAKQNSDEEEEERTVPAPAGNAAAMQTDRFPAEAKHQQTEIQQQRPHNKRKMDKVEQQNVATAGNLEKRKRKRKRPKKK